MPLQSSADSESDVLCKLRATHVAGVLNALRLVRGATGLAMSPFPLLGWGVDTTPSGKVFSLAVFRQGQGSRVHGLRHLFTVR
jgi:hypothetical protein